MLKVGIIGTGFGMYGHLPAFATTNNCQVVSICGEKSERLSKFCKKYKVEKVYSDWKEMLKAEKLDAVSIAVVPDAQYEIAKFAIKKGINVFAEKPLTANLKQAEELYRLSQKAKITTAVDFIFPQVPEFKKVKELLVKKEIGELEYIKAEWDFLSHDLARKLKSWKTDSKKGGGALAYYFSHVLYYLTDFLGEITFKKAQLIHSQKSLSGGEAGVDVFFKAKKATGIAHLNCSAEGLNRHSIIFTGGKGGIVLENKQDVVQGFEITVYRNSKVKKVKAGKKFIANEDQRVAIVKENVSKFVEGCLKHKPIKPSFKEGLEVQKLISHLRKISI
jgi:predicted dehydrogenase